jgi:hypothetical protein
LRTNPDFKSRWCKNKEAPKFLGAFCEMDFVVFTLFASLFAIKIMMS